MTSMQHDKLKSLAGTGLSVAMICFAVALISGCSANIQADNRIPQSRKPEYSRLISFYQNYISPVDGDRCTMYPGCSSYSAAAINEHGMVIGALMTFDRLLRCGRDQHLYEHVWIRGAEYNLDEVRKNNDQRTGKIRE